MCRRSSACANANRAFSRSPGSSGSSTGMTCEQLLLDPLPLGLVGLLHACALGAGGGRLHQGHPGSDEIDESEQAAGWVQAAVGHGLLENPVPFTGKTDR